MTLNNGAFAERLQQARKASGLTYGALAERAGISKSHVWELAKGRVSNPTIGLTEKLADALDCDRSWLAGWSEQSTLERALDRMGWPEIHAFEAELRKGQDIREDAGGFMMRAIKALFGVQPRDPVQSYRTAAAALIAQAIEARRAETQGGSVHESAIRQDAPENTPISSKEGTDAF